MGIKWKSRGRSTPFGTPHLVKKKIIIKGRRRIWDIFSMILGRKLRDSEDTNLLAYGIIYIEFNLPLLTYSL